MLSDGRLYIHFEGRADRFADELHIWYGIERKVKEDPML